MSCGGADGLLWSILCCHLSLSSVSSPSTGLVISLSVAVFFSPFCAAIKMHRILGSCHLGLMLTNVFVPMKEAAAVSSR